MSATFQPRYAAFAASYGRDGDQSFVTARNNAAFMAWIQSCKSTAPATAVDGELITNHDQFTAHCWSVAREDCLKRFPA